MGRSSQCGEQDRGHEALHAERVEGVRRRLSLPVQTGPDHQAEQTPERDQEQQQGAMACVEVIGDDQSDPGEAQDQSDPLTPADAFPEQRAGHRGDQEWLQRADECSDARGDAVVDAGEDQAQVDELGQDRHPHLGHEVSAGDRRSSDQQDHCGKRAGEEEAPGEQVERIRVLRAPPGADESAAPEHDEPGSRSGGGEAVARRTSYLENRHGRQ